MLNNSKKAVEEGIELLNQITNLLSKGIDGVRTLLKDIWKKIVEWFKANLKVVKPNFEKVPNLSKSEIDWMASRKVGNLGGNVLKANQIRKLRGILKSKGIVLIVEGDSKVVTKLFKPVYIEEGNIINNVEDFFYYMRNKKPPYVGGFDAVNKQFILPKRLNDTGKLEFLTTELTVFHEMAHVKHYEELGNAYHSLKELEKEMYVWKQILGNRGKWTNEELLESLDYINRTRKKYKQKPLSIK